MIDELRVLCADCWYELNELGGEDFPHRGQRVTMPEALKSLGIEMRLG